MKKRITSFFLALLLLASMVVVPANAVTTALTETTLPEVCPCGCGEAFDQLQWRVWNPNNGQHVSNGHYYLENNYVQDEQFGISAGEKIVLDLRGYELSGADYGRLFLDNGYLAVVDTVGGGKMSAKTAGNGFGGLLLMQTDGTFELYGGTVTVDVDNKASRRGGLISVGTRCTFNMYGGMVMGGNSDGTTAEEGGCIASATSSATIQILGGTVMGGYSPKHGGNIYSKGTLILKNCKVMGGTADGYGGNIYQSGGSITVENCEISHGVSNGTATTVTGGGNICAVSSAKVTVKDTKIHNGYAASYGGNVYAGSGSQSFENVTITAGVSGKEGGNIRIAASAVETLTDCTIDGDVSGAGTLTLAGKTKIGLRNTGLSLTGSLSAKDLCDGAEIYISAEGALPDAKAEYFKPAIRTVLTENENGLVATTAADGEIAGYCPHCNTRVAWTACGNTAFSADGHYYLSATQSSYGQKTINNDIVLDLNGFNLTGTSRAFFAKEGSALALLDSVGGSTVTMTGAADGHGGIIRNDKGNLKIFGGKYVLKAGRNVRCGGIIYTSGKTNIAGGVFDASVYENTADNGANIYQLSGAAYSLNISAGYFMGGRTNYGGALYMGYNVKTNITGGHFTGGSAATTGGNLYVEGKSSYKTGTLQIHDVAITNGHADTSGGNVSITYYETVSVADSYIAKGSATKYGGNIHANTNSTFARYENCVIYGGSSQRGGNVYDGALGGRIRLTNCEILEGAASAAGGNICVNHGYVEIKGGTVAYGTAAEDGGNIYSAAGSSNEDGAKNYLKLLQDSNGNAPMLLGGVAGDSGGNIYFYGVCHLTDAHIQNGRAKTSGADLYRGKGSLQNVLSVGEGVTGNISIFVNSGLLGSPVYGQEVVGATAETLKATITLEGDYGMPQLCAKDGALVVAGAVLVGGETVEGYAVATDAAADCKEGQYVKLFTDAVLTLNKDATVDLNGFTANVSGNGALLGMDSAGGGKAVWETAANTAEVTFAPDGKHYVAVQNGAEATYHLLDMAITGVAIRPSEDGMYYTGKWNCDEALLAQLDSYGVAVDTVAEPGNDFVTNETTLWTEFEASTMVSGESKTGAIISGIMKQERKAALNDAYGKMPVFAAAYVKLKSGTTIVSDSVGYSLHSVMQSLETLVEQNPATYGKYMYNAGAFYRQWKANGMGSWDFNRISIDPLCPWNYNVVEKAVQSGEMHYYFMSGEWHAYSGGNSEPEKWGDSCLIVFLDGQTMLIDTGVTQYGPILVENLKRMGVTKIDHLVISHPHSDHQNGAFSNKNNTSGVGLLDQFAIGQVYHRGGYDSQNLVSSQLVETVCAERNLPLQILEMGDTLQIGEVAIQVLWPKVGTSEKDTTGVNAAATNNTSVVMRFDYKNHSSLFTGDLYTEREAELIKTYEADVLDVDLLKAPHHGNGITSNSEAFVNAVSPEIAVATGFEAISASTELYYSNAGATLLGDRTYGYIHVTTDGETMDYETSRTSAFTEGLDGKRVLFVGNSFMHYGKAVLYNYTSTEEARHNDAGYFYQLCKSQGAEVDVVNWTYSGLSLQNIMDQHIPDFQDYNYDYVILNCDRSSTHTIESYEKLMEQYIQVFRGANPNVKMYLLVTSGTHNISVKETFPMDLLNNLDRIEAMDIRVLDWGKLVADIIRGETQVPGATKEYNKYSFIHNATAEDGYHPNQLTGYIISMFVYSALTGESAVGLPYDFWCDSSISDQFDPQSYLEFGYQYGPTNYQEIFNSPADMAGLQQLVDRYIAEKAYLDYNFTEVPKN
ncbi:MAG: MBL fold metallo-hydrolase [Oscillospiraceae bacterium]|nr:MBL fold metallo-hydrolase [Oscillospiraceae bacterium]